MNPKLFLTFAVGIMLPAVMAMAGSDNSPKLVGVWEGPEPFSDRRTLHLGIEIGSKGDVATSVWTDSSKTMLSYRYEGKYTRKDDKITMTLEFHKKDVTLTIRKLTANELEFIDDRDGKVRKLKRIKSGPG